eukprot:6213430-Pleurochrysis_carterae.AAC.4
MRNDERTPTLATPRASKDFSSLESTRTTRAAADFVRITMPQVPRSSEICCDLRSACFTVLYEGPSAICSACFEHSHVPARPACYPVHIDLLPAHMRHRARTRKRAPAYSSVQQSSFCLSLRLLQHHSCGQSACVAPVAGADIGRVRQQSHGEPARAAVAAPLSAYRRAVAA